ncbi:hypothetical protein ACS0TY_025759 [Phlomoides rotata]
MVLRSSIEFHRLCRDVVILQRQNIDVQFWVSVRLRMDMKRDGCNPYDRLRPIDGRQCLIKGHPWRFQFAKGFRLACFKFRLGQYKQFPANSSADGRFVVFDRGCMLARAMSCILSLNMLMSPSMGDFERSKQTVKVVSSPLQRVSETNNSYGCLDI